MKKLLLLGALAVLAQAANAAEVTFCSTERLNANVNPLSDKREFTCGNGMTGTLPELAKKGWSVQAINLRESPTHDMGSWVMATIVLRKD